MRVRIPAGAAGEFSSPQLNFVFRLSFVVRSFPVLPQWHIKDPGYFTKSAGDKLHLNIHTLSTKRSLSGLTMWLSKQSVGTYPETSSHATCQETFGHSRLSSLS